VFTGSGMVSPSMMNQYWYEPGRRLGGVGPDPPGVLGQVVGLGREVALDLHRLGVRGLQAEGDPPVRGHFGRQGAAALAEALPAGRRKIEAAHATKARMRSLMVRPLEGRGTRSADLLGLRVPPRRPAPRSRTSVSASPGRARRASAPDRLARLPEPPKHQRPAGVRATVRARASVRCVSRSTSPRCSSRTASPARAGIGRRASGEFRWVRALPPGEGRQEDELVGGDAVRRERCVRPAVQRQVRGAECDREVASGGHRRLRQNSCVYAQSSRGIIWRGRSGCK
jgi:hypothetical protein